MNSLSAFLAMGGYGGYVWSAFGAAATVVLSLIYQNYQIKRRVVAYKLTLDKGCHE